MEPFEILCQSLNEKLSSLLIYGEARLKGNTIPNGANHVNEKNEPCSVNDGYNTVLFWVKNNSEPEGAGFGKQRSKRVLNSYTLVANSKKDVHDLVLSVLNELQVFTYSGSDFRTASIAEQFFGLTESNYETRFFTIDFQVIENIKPGNCEGC